ncbi:unnamed protein product [Ostreobium quekettii]|uniref:Uncharacterized protein n=1 Tax=Ostreobium quekettii TaxID=121088 RepID=A0A8S1JH39_9CHLO|nr:unnamed protein product [Ostreobium quekettii]
MGKRGKFELPGTGSDRSKGRQRKVSCRSLNSGNASEGPLPPRPASRLKSSTDEDCSPSTGADTPSGTAAPDCNGPVRDRDAGKGEEGKESCPTVVAAGPPRPAVPFCEDASSQSPDSPCALDSLPCTEISIGSTTVIPSVAPSPVPAASDIGKSAEARPAGLSPLPNCVQLEPPRPKSRAGRRTPDIASASKVKKKPAWSSQWQNEQRREVKGGSGTAPRTELSIKCSNVTRSAGPKIDVREEIGDSGSIQGRKAVSRKPSRRARPYGPGSVGNEVTGASRTSEEFSQVMENGKAQVTIGRGETDSALQAAAMEVGADSANEACCAAALTTHGSFASSTGTGHAAGSQDILRSSSASPCGLEGRQKRLGNIEVVMCTSDGMAEGQVSVVVLPVDVPSSTPAVPLKSRAPSPAVEMEQVQSHTDVPASVPSMETLLDTEPPKGLSKKFRDHFALRDGIAGSGVALLEEKVLDVLEMTGALLKLAKDNPAMQALQNGKSPAPAQLKQHATEMDACMETGMPVEQGAARTPDAPLIGGSSTDDGDGVHATPSLPAAAEGTDPPMEEPREMSESRPGRDSSQVGCASVEEADDRSETETTSSEPELPVAPRGYALWSPPEAEGPPDEANTRDGYNAPLSTAMLTSDADAVRPSLHEDGLQSWAIPQFQGDDVQLSIFKALVGPALKQEGTIQASTDNQMPIEERPTQGGETVQPGLRNLGTHKRREVHKTSQGTSPHADSEYAALLDGEVADCAAGARRVEGDGHSDASRPASSLRPVDAVCGDGARLPPRAQGPVTEAVGDVSQAEWPHVYTVQLPGLDRSDGKAMSATHDDFEFDPPSPRHSDLPKLVGGYEVWSFNPMWQEDRRTPTPSFGEPCLSERSIPSHRDWSPSPAPSSCGRATPTGARRAADGGEGCTEGGGAVEVVGAGGGPNPRGHSSAMSIHGDDPIPAIVQEAAGEKFAVSYVNGKSSRGNLVELVASEANDASGVEAQNGEIVYEKAAESKDEVLSLGAHPHVDPPPEQVVDDLKQETVCPQPIEAKEATTPCGGNAAKNTAEVAPAIAEVIEADGSMLQGKQGKDSTAEADDQAAADLGTISSLSSLAGKKEQVDMHSLIQTTNSTIPKVLKQQPADEISPEEESTGALMEGLKGIQSQGQDPPPCGEEVSPSAKEAAVYAVLEPAKAYEDSVLLDGKEKGIASSEKSPSSEALTDNVPCTEWLTAVGEDATDRQEGKVEPTHCTSEECTPHQPAAICRTTAPGGDACPRNSSPKMYTDVETSVSTSPLSCIPKPTVAGAATGAEVAHLVAVDSVDEVVEAMATAAGEGLVPAAAKPEKEAVAAAFGVPASSKMASSADMEPTLGASNLPVQEMADITPALASAEETQGPGTPHYGNGILDVEGSISAERIAHEVAAGSTEMLQDKEEPDGGNDETLAQELPTTVSQAVAAANSDLQKPHGSPGPQEGASTPQQTIGRTKPVAAGTKNRVLCADMLPQVERPAVDDQAEANVVVQEGATEKDPVEERDTKPLTETHGAKGPVMKAAAEKKNVTKTTTLKKLRSSASSVSKSLGCGCFGGLLVKAGNFTRAS